MEKKSIDNNYNLLKSSQDTSSGLRSDKQEFSGSDRSISFTFNCNACPFFPRKLVGVSKVCDYPNYQNENKDHQERCNDTNNIKDVLQELKEIRRKNINRIIIAHLNINSLANKFDQLKLIIQDNIDILVIGETKLDDTFPNNQFNIEGFCKPYRMDRNKFGGGVMIFVREDIPSKQMTNHTIPDDIESLFIEINLKKSKFLLLGGYRPPRQSNAYCFETTNRTLDIP